MFTWRDGEKDGDTHGLRTKICCSFLFTIFTECVCVCDSYSGSLLLSPVRPKLLDMASPEATETQSHTERDRESVC